MAGSYRIVRAETAVDHRLARGLFEMYAVSLDFDLEFQDFEAEMARFPGEYAEPSGCILLARGGERTLGCVGLRRLDAGLCEMKRLYVCPEARGLGLGRRLAEGIIDEARRRGYERMRLDTVPSMREAGELYAALGFEPIEPYRDNPVPGATFLELDLRR
jgi:GNAT superfamily N-acetyltransferase